MCGGGAGRYYKVVRKLGAAYVNYLDCEDGFTGQNLLDTTLYMSHLLSVNHRQ